MAFGALFPRVLVCTRRAAACLSCTLITRWSRSRKSAGILIVTHPTSGASFHLAASSAISRTLEVIRLCWVLPGPWCPYEERQFTGMVSAFVGIRY